MTRRTAALLVALVAAPLALAYQEPGWQLRLNEFDAKAAVERRKLGLDGSGKKDALYGKYPTPEVTFGAPVVLCPGATGTIRIGGVIPPGALLVPRSDAVQVVKEKVTATGWEATVRVAPGAAPDEVSFEAVTPVSGASATARGLVIGCKHSWTLDAGGDTLVLTTEFGASATAQVRGQWRRGNKVLGVTAYVATRGSRSLALQEEQSMEQMQASAGGFQEVMASKAWADLDARTQVQMKALEGCGKLPPEKMGPCFAAPQKEMETITKERDGLIAAAEKKGAPAFGCRQLRVNVVDGSAPGTVEGDAEECAGKRRQERVDVTGRYAAP